MNVQLARAVQVANNICVRSRKEHGYTICVYICRAAWIETMANMYSTKHMYMNASSLRKLEVLCHLYNYNHVYSSEERYSYVGNHGNMPRVSRKIMNIPSRILEWYKM